MTTFLAVRHTPRRGGVGPRRARSPPPRRHASRPTVATIVHGVLVEPRRSASLVALGFIAGGLGCRRLARRGPRGRRRPASPSSASGCSPPSSCAPRAARTASPPRSCVAAYFLRGIGDALGTPSADGLHMTQRVAELALADRLGPGDGGLHRRTGSPRCCSTSPRRRLIAAVFLLQARRDTGRACSPGRAGRADARASLSGSLGARLAAAVADRRRLGVGGAPRRLLAGTLGSVVSPATHEPIRAMQRIVRRARPGGHGR